MIYVLYGTDALAVRERLAALRDAVEPPDLREANISSLDGESLVPDELLAAAMAVPFLSNRRLVIVRGLLTRFDGRRSGTPAAWKGIADRLGQVPEVNDVAFVDGPLGSAPGPLLRELSQVANVERCQVPRGAALRRWIRERVRNKGGDISEAAATMLERAAGGDIVALDSELEKLAVYASGRQIEPSDVEQMVTASREANIFAAVDAALAGRSGPALSQMHQVLRDGQSVGYVLYMLHRQVRLLILAKELQRKGVGPQEMGKRLGVRGYPLQKTLEQAPRFTQERLAAAHRLLAEADERVKSGGARDEVALDLLLSDLADLARIR
ncbi:MAG: DNA polymerase III subunit delta [Dehalococcoidia bacterium]|nr:DNA polymerase III subunit delta [Dehalococcoidia bacterium]